MRNLIPVKRADKNGVVSTKWVKPDKSAAAALSASIPQLVAKESVMLAEELNIDTKRSGISLVEVRKKALRLPGATSAVLLEMMEKATSLYSAQAIIVCALHHDDTPDMMESIAVVYNDYVYQELSWQTGSHEAYESITGDIRGMRKYPQFTNVDNVYHAGATTRHQASQIALLHYEADKEGKLTVVSTGEGNAHYIDYPDIAGQIIDLLDTPERADDFMETLYEKGFDPELIAVTLDTTVPLRDGAL